MTNQNSTTTNTDALQGYVRPKEAAKILGIGYSTLGNLRSWGKGPKYRKIGARTILYKPEDLRAWMDQTYPEHTSTSEYA